MTEEKKYSCKCGRAVRPLTAAAAAAAKFQPVSRYQASCRIEHARILYRCGQQANTMPVAGRSNAIYMLFIDP